MRQKVHLTKREVALIRNGTLAISIAGLVAMWAESSPSSRSSYRQGATDALIQASAEVASTATPEPDASPTPFVPFELDGNKAEEFAAEEEREMEAYRNRTAR